MYVARRGNRKNKFARVLTLSSIESVVLIFANNFSRSNDAKLPLAYWKRKFHGCTNLLGKFSGNLIIIISVPAKRRE